MARGHRIAIGGFLHETNTFVSSRADIAAFQSGGGYPGLCFGQQVLEVLYGVNCGLSGFISAARAENELVPLAWAVAVPSGPVTSDAYNTITGKITQTLTTSGDLDAIYLDLHGAMVTDNCDDGEGELLEAIRAVAGHEIPIIVSLDLHANVSQRMVDLADVLVSYKTYPHIDMADTGRRSYEILGAMLANGKKPAKAFRQMSFLIPTVAQCTLMEPARTIYNELGRLERAEGVTSLSFNPGFPAADIIDCRPSVTGYGHDKDAVERAVSEIAAMIADREPDFVFPLLSAHEAVREAMLHARIAAPVVIADTQDNPGGGSSSDTMGILRALLDLGAENAAIGLVADPLAAQAAHLAGVGRTITLSLGGRGGFTGDFPFAGEFLVEALSDGEVRMSGGLYGYGTGQLGKSACLRIGGVQIAVSSATSQMADQQMFRYVGIEPKDKSILVVKSTIHFRANFDPIAARTIVAAAPGGMIADPAALDWTSLAPDVRLSPMGRRFEA